MSLHRSHSITAAPPPSHGTGYFFTTHTSSRHDVRPSSTCPSVNNYPLSRLSDLRAPRSMSFLKTRRSQLSPSTEIRQEVNDLAVQMARERYMQQVSQQQSIMSQPSTHFRSTRKRSEASQGFRKSLRNVSNTSTTVSAGQSSTSNLAISKDATIRKTARKVSNSLKNKLKSLFRKGASVSVKNDHDSFQGIRPQHDGAADAAENDHQDVETDGASVDPEVEECTFTQGAVRLPSLHAVPSHQQLRSRQGSLESIRSSTQRPSEDKSRVTSWASTAATTLDSDKAYHRLSVIKEAGAHPSTVYSESVYTDNRLMSPASNAKVARSGGVTPYSPAAAVDRPPIIQTYSPTMPFQTPMAAGHRTVSAASSVEWKLRLAAHVSRDEETASNIRRQPSKSTLRKGLSLLSGHMREKANIEDDEPLALSTISHNTSKTTLDSYHSQALTDNPNQPSKTSVLHPAGITSMKPPQVPARSSLRPIVPGNFATPSSIFASTSRSAQSSLKTLRTMPDLRNEARVANKENAAPAVASHSASPAKLLRPLPAANHAQLRPRSGENFGQTTVLGSPIARLGNRAQGLGVARFLHKGASNDLTGQDGGAFKSPGTQRMVDDFLNSRRKALVGEDDGDAFI